MKVEMPRKSGEIRPDGRVFYQYNKGKEVWVSAECYHKNVTAKKEAVLERRRLRYLARDEKKRAWEKQLEYWKENKDALADLARVRNLERQREKRRLDPEKFRKNDRNYLERVKQDPVRLEKRREYYREYWRRTESARRELADKARAERELKKAAKLAEIEARKETRRIAAEERRIKEALRPKRVKVILTDEQRLEAKRRDRKNRKHRRRAILRGQEAKATPKQIEAQRVKAKGKCYYCRQKFKHLTIDHIVPIAKGGGHTLDNIVFACHACNSEKRDLAPEEYGKKHGLLLV